MFAFVVCLLTLYSFQIGILTAQGQTQYFQHSLSKNYTYPKGVTIILPCVVRNRQGECLWIHDGVGLGYIQNKYVFSRTPENGDCSLTIHDLSFERDDGLWQCQVTQTSLYEKPLQSEVVSVTVLIPPGKPQIKKRESSRLESFAFKQVEVECSIARGNPPPIIYWDLNGENITDKAGSVTSYTPTVKPEALNTISTLRITFKKEQNNATLTCIALHPLINQNDSAVLNVYYSPEVEVSREKYTIIEGNELTINCKVDANPAATVIWRRSGTNSAIDSNPQFGRNVLYFEKVTRDLNGLDYECTAQNAYGVAKPANVKFDVLYIPTVVNTSQTQSVLTGHSARLYCHYDGNPSPVIRWFHINPRTGALSLVKRASGKNQHILDLVNVTYIQEGEYYCEGINTINNIDNIVPTKPIEVHVYGAPAFLTPFRIITIQRGETSELTLAFCSDPSPYKVFWQFGSIKINVRLAESLASSPYIESNKSLHERLVVSPLMPLILKRHLKSASSCYESTMLIKDTDISDQRDYILVVENEKGMSEGLVKLKVVQPLSATMVVATLLSIIAVVLVISIISLLLVKRKRKCKERVSYEESKEDAQVLSQNVKSCESPEEKIAVKTTSEGNHELVYANLDFPKDPSKPPPTRPKPQMRPTHQRPMNTGVGTEYAKLAFPTKADL